MRVPTPRVIPLREQQEMLDERRQKLTAEWAAVGRWLQALGAADLPPADFGSANFWLFATLVLVSSKLMHSEDQVHAPHPEELVGMSKAELLRASPTMFDTKWMDRASRVNHLVPVYIFLPAIVALLVLGFIDHVGVWAIAWIAGGYLIWTLTEYWLHRSVFHFEPEHGILARFHWIVHGVHHDHPNDPTRLVMPPSASVPLAALFLFVFYLIFGTPGFWSLGAGFLGGYLFYDMLHYHVHHRQAKTRLGKWVRELHMRHHFQDPYHGYGISAPFWDYIFRTELDRRGGNRHHGASAH